MTGRIGRMFIFEGSGTGGADGDPGAAMDALEELRGIVEGWHAMNPSQLDRELRSWFKTNLDAIQQALGIEEGQGGDGEPMEARKPPLGSGERFARLERQLAREGGPGSGPRPKSGGPAGQGDTGGGAGPDTEPDDEAGDAPEGLPSDVMRTLRDIFQSLKDIVQDDDSDDDDEPADDGGPPGPSIGERADDPAALAASIGRKKFGRERFQQMAAAGRRRKG